jgi:hypothetical protein
VNETDLSVKKVRNALSELGAGRRYGEQKFTHGTIFHLPAAPGSDFRFFLEAGSAPMVKAYRNTSIVGKVTESYAPGMKFHKDEIWCWPFDDDDYAEMERDEYVQTVIKDFLEFVTDIFVHETCIVIKKRWFGATRQCQAHMKEGWISLPRFSRKLTDCRPIPHSDCTYLYRSPPIASR